MLNDVVNVHSKGFKPVGQRQPDGFYLRPVGD